MTTSDYGRIADAMTGVRCWLDGESVDVGAALRECAAERDAYRRAKAENDERYMLERDEARRERDEARAALREICDSAPWIDSLGSTLDFPKARELLARARAAGWR